MFPSVCVASVQLVYLLCTTQALLLWMLRGPGYQPGLTYRLGPSHIIHNKYIGYILTIYTLKNIE